MANLPKPEKPLKSKKKFGCLQTGILAVLLLLVVLHFTISTIAVKVANKQLPDQLQTDAEVGNIDILLPLGKIGVQDLNISQPEGFGDGSLLKMNTFKIVVPPGKAIAGKPIEIRNLHLDGLHLNLISDTNQVMNVTTLGPPAKEEPVEETESESAAPPPLWLQQLLFENIQVTFKDLAKEWEIELQDIRLDIQNLQVEYEADTGPGLVTGDVHFPNGRAMGKLKIRAKVGNITPSKPETTPAIQLAMGLIGFDLDLVSPFLSPSPMVAKTAIGGSGFDFTLFLEIQPGNTPEEQKIGGKFELSTDGGHVTNDSLGGTLAEPVLPFTSLFADILGNQFGRITKLGGNVAKGGLEAGKAVADTGVAAVKGVGKTVGGFAGGVLKTAKGVVTLDKDDVVGGMKDATVGTAGDLANTVKDTAGTAGSGLKDTAGAATGSTDVEAWWSEIDNRMSEFDTAVNEWFEENPFPKTAD